MMSTIKRDTIEMALEAGFSIRSNWAEQELKAFEALVRADEREQDIQRLSALVRAQQITIDKLEAQRTWVGLTDEDIKGADWVLSAVKEYEAYTLQEQLVIEGVAEFAQAIEAKLKEKNT
jgi:hypothetical protein